MMQATSFRCNMFEGKHFLKPLKNGVFLYQVPLYSGENGNDRN